MKRSIALLGVLIPCFLVSGFGGDSHESIRKETIKAMNEMCDILGSIKDKASAEAAKSKMEKLSERMQDLKKRADKLGEPSAEVKSALEKKYKAELEQVGQRFVKEVFRMATMEDGQGLQDMLKSFGDAMNK